MRIAYDISFFAYNYLTGNRKSGVYRVIQEVLASLRAREDTDISLVSACHRNPILANLIYERYLREPLNLQQTDYIRTIENHSLLLGPFQSFNESYLRKMLKASDGKAPKSWALWGLMKALEQVQKTVLTQKLDSRRIDVFHSPFLRFPAKKVTGDIPRVLTVYDLIPVLAPEYTEWGFTQFIKRTIRGIDIHNDFVICISEHTKKEFVDYTRMSPDRVFVTPLAANDSFHPVTDKAVLDRCRKQYLIPDGDYFLTLAELQPRKNLVRLTSSFIRFLSSSRRKDVYLVLVGSSGWKYDEIFKTIGSLSDHRDKIIFTGYVRDEDLAAIYGGAEMFIYPSLYEGFGLPALEAMQCGTPVIASKSTSIPEVVGDAGLLIDPLNTDDMCNAMLTLSNDASLRRQLREKGLEQAKHFSWAKCADDTVKAYRSISGR